MNNSDARPRMAAVLLETSFFQPIKHILKSNILQYQPPTTLYNRDLKQQVEINPAELRKIIWEFKIADGVLPVDKLVNLELFGQAFQFAQTVRKAAAEYDLMGMYIYVKTPGSHLGDDFKRTPQQQQEVLNALSPPRPLLELSHQQLEILQQMYARVVQDLLAVHFSDSSRDAENMRYHASLTGKKQVFEKILNHDKELIEDMQETINTTLE